MSAVGGLLATLGFGIGSAFVPLLNTEVYTAALAGRGGVVLVVAGVFALALGQTLGKVVLAEAARRGSGRLTRIHSRRGHGGQGRWSARIARAFAQRRTAVPFVLTSAAVGVPPLAVVSLASGAAHQPRRDFALACLAGRTLRFGLIAAPISALAWG